MMISAQRIHDLKSPYIRYVSGPLTLSAKKPLPPEVWESGSLAFVSTQSDLDRLISLQAPILIASSKLKLPPETKKTCFFQTESVSAAMATLLPFFDLKMSRVAAGIHPTAVIASTAQVASTAKIGPYCVVGEGASIGEHAVLSAHVVVENQALVGSKTFLHPHVVIGAFCEIGHQVEIHSHTTIGSDGYGYVSDPQDQHHKIPQIGKVVIEDRVEIGASCAIDRATLHETRIGSGTKLDNLVHVAHNCKIGKNCLITAGFFIAGSSTIGDNCVTGGNVAIADHVHVTSKVQLGGRSTVTKDITEPGVYTGYPVESLKDGLRTIASLPHLTTLRKQVAEIRKKLNLED
ncbi:MAG: UDP-3-O-(3-hydroxymyristoyl)glucosamine N-acyltransferase [Proteobacteria bacterium]|jgi:UDP-3-O-[3-hydroxymyristoyl] glucosamine N-acyltransferase|nr:UDP-3-O-(3-hydroxymyristoyl)glucosamine N-acyltransferase [Pseudomonadota bacterium]